MRPRARRRRRFYRGGRPDLVGHRRPPGSYDADIAVGDLQPLGIHMSCGTGVSCFMAFRDDDRSITECPFAIYAIVETDVPCLLYTSDAADE